MTYEILIEKAKGLSDEQLNEIGNYIDFLKYKLRHADTSSTRTKKRELGWFKDGLKYMAEDFDETPVEFQEYV